MTEKDKAQDAEFKETVTSPVPAEAPETAKADMPTDPTAPEKVVTPERPDGWEGVIWDCERAFGCEGHETDPKLSNVPNLITQYINERNDSLNEARNIKSWIHERLEGDNKVNGLEDVKVKEPMLTMLKCPVPCDTKSAIEALAKTHCSVCHDKAKKK